MAKLKIISLGWGVQSWVLAAMVALGELKPVDFVIHSDTTWEHQHTYRFAEQWGPWLENHGVKLITVSDKPAAKRAITHAIMPAYTSDGGQLMRTCTDRWKIRPVRRFIASELARRGVKKTPGAVEQWLGITTDEWQRAKSSPVKYISTRFPLLDINMSRGDCITWLNSHGLPVPGKSSCTFCPYHNDTAWGNLKRNDGPDWQQAIEVDNAIRSARPNRETFLHRRRLPLVDAVVIPEDYGAEQLELFELENAPCDSGYCFL